MSTLSLKTLLNPVLFTDSYKLSHKAMEPKGTELIYSNFTPRFNKYFKTSYPNHDGKTVVFGLYPFLLEFLKDHWNDGFFNRPKDEVMGEISQIVLPYIGMTSDQLQHFSDLHDLGYLPLRVKALPEGSLVNPNVPVLTVVNTHKDFSWLTNYIESVLSAELWKPMTVATFAREFSILADHWFDKTSDNTYRKFAIHDFSYRGHGTHREAAVCGAAPLLYSTGTDNIPGVTLARVLYNAPEDVAGSVPASEHSVTTLGINFYKNFKLTGELEYFTEILKNRMSLLGIIDEYEKAVGELITMYRLLTEVYPTGIFSYVADSYDYWRVLTVIVPILSKVILRRDGKFVIRPDSGNPVQMVCGTKQAPVKIYDDKEIMNLSVNDEFTVSDHIYKLVRPLTAVQPGYYLPLFELRRNNFIIDVTDEKLSDEERGSIDVLASIFSEETTVNSKGYKELPPQIGLIYGDGITYQRASDIYSQLAAKGYAASNVVLGVGSYSFAGGTRDTLGFAIKATYAEVDGVPTPIYKEPKTDSSKRSARGLMQVVKDENGELILRDQVNWEDEAAGELKVVFENGNLFNQPDFTEIRTRLGFYGTSFSE